MPPWDLVSSLYKMRARKHPRPLLPCQRNFCSVSRGTEQQVFSLARKPVQAGTGSAVTGRGVWPPFSFPFLWSVCSSQQLCGSQPSFSHSSEKRALLRPNKTGPKLMWPFELTSPERQTFSLAHTGPILPGLLL